MEQCSADCNEEKVLDMFIINWSCFNVVCRSLFMRASSIYVGKTLIARQIPVSSVMPVHLSSLPHTDIYVMHLLWETSANLDHSYRSSPGMVMILTSVPAVGFESS